MNDKVRGTIAVFVGLFALWQSYVYYQKSGVTGRFWIDVVAGVALIGIGLWRILRKPVDLSAELLK